ncbi:MAG TPA: GNAT family N-acetyltransferase [Pirellulales bacterium]|nr:GNAT family N-acetyltransferase [Pirellulales bacterium]
MSSSPAPNLMIEVARPDERAAALALLSGTADDAPGHTYDGLLVARRDGRLVGAIWAQRYGTGGELWPPRSADGEPAITKRALLRAAVDCLARSGVSLVQTVIRPDEADAALWQAEGFEHLATLDYLTCDLDRIAVASLPGELEFEPYDAGNRPRLAEVVRRSYVGTLDCPRLNGRRDTADVLAEYQAIGRFDPARWSIVCAQERDVGCLILSEPLDPAAWELTYMGLVPEARGRGWGLQIVRYAQRLARRACCRRIVLAVDQANVPARRVYESAGFIGWDQREAWLRFF